MNNQLTRQRNLQLAKRRMDAQRARQGQPMQVPAGAPGVDVAGCGPDWNQGGFPSPGYPWNADMGVIGLPQLAPPPGPGTLVRNLYRLGAVIQCFAGARTIELFPAGGASLYVNGILTRNDPFNVIIEDIDQGATQFSPVSQVDAAVFNCDVCYCPIELGCANSLTPLVITFSPFGASSTLPFLNLCAVGTFQAGWGTCGVPYGDGYSTPLPSMPGTGGYFPQMPGGHPAPAGMPAG